MREARYHVTLAFWRWCYDNGISGTELARETGYATSLVNRARQMTGTHTVSQRFVDRVEAAYYLPEGMTCFVPVHTPVLQGDEPTAAPESMPMNFAVRKIA